MGHRHLFGTSQMFESEPEQGRNHLHVEQPYANIARSSSTEHVSFFYPVENMPVDAVHFSSHWNSMPRSSGFATSSHNVEAPRYQPDTSGPSHDLFLHSSAPRTFGSAPENYMHHASSSNYDRQTFQGIEGGLVDLPMSSGRGPHKRKSPGVPSVCERGGSSRYAGAGSSSDIPLSSDFWQEKANADPQHMYWDHISMPPSCRGNGLSIRGECSMRNVRSRPALDLESNLVRTHLSSNTSYLTSHPVERSSSVDVTGQTSNAMSRDWSHLRMSPSHGRIPAADSNAFNHETNHFPGGSSATNASVEVGGLQHNFISGRNPVLPQGFHGNSAQSVRGARTNYFQRSSPNFRASSSSVHIGHAASYEEGMQVVSESYSTRHPRPLSAVTWRNNEWSGRSRISNDRYQSLADDAAFHGRFSSEGFMIVDRSAFYGSRNMFDQHSMDSSEHGSTSPKQRLTVGLVVSFKALWAKHAGRVSKKLKPKHNEFGSLSDSPRSLAVKSPGPKRLLTTLSNKAIKLVNRKKAGEKTGKEEEIGDGGVWQRAILMGDKCQPLDFSGVIYYDSKGNQVEELPFRSPRASPMPAYLTSKKTFY